MTHAPFIVITPTRNDAAHLPLTIESMVQQKQRPVCWVLVNDGSSDQTGALADQAAARHSWIRVIHRKDRGSRRAGGGVVETFNEGFNSVASGPWEYVVKLDGDLSFEADYFAGSLARFGSDSRLGIGGGLVCLPSESGSVEEYNDPPFHVRGPVKMYRRRCWDEIGGLMCDVGWDTFDQVKANMLGWKTQTFPEHKVLHHRPTGRAYGSWSNWQKNGLANYILGYHPLFMLLKCVRRAFQPPFGVAAMALMYGFLKGYTNGRPQVEAEVVRYLRQQQFNYLLGRPSLWKGYDSVQR